MRRMLLLVFGVWVSIVSAFGEGSQAGFAVASSPEAERLLGQVAAAKGGVASLARVTSLRLTTVRAIDGSAAMETSYAMLFPASFRKNGPALHVLNGDTYWQRPEPSERILPRARANTYKAFAEWSLLLLARAPATFPVRAEATRIRWDGTERPALRMVGDLGFNYTFVIGADGDFDGFVYGGSLTQGGVTETVQRRVSVLERDVRDGIRFPTRLREEIGTFGATVSVTSLEVNPPLTAGDFAPPRAY